MNRLSFISLAGIASLILMVSLSIDAGISGDEKVRMEHAESVIDYFQTFGKDKAALHTPRTYLKYYGQSFDNLTTLIVRIFKIEEIYRFRHICNAIAGWFILLFTFLIGRMTGGKWAGFAAALFLLASPRFMGHSFNNLIDIPFALGYTSSAYFLLRWMKEWPNKNKQSGIGLILSIAFTLSIRPAGLLIICYLWLFALLAIWYSGQRDKKSILSILKHLLYISFSGYFLGLLFWPYALENPLWHPIKSLFIMSDYPVTMRQLFEGTLQWSDQLPWTYIFKFIFISTPVPIILLFLSSPLLFLKPDRFVGKLEDSNANEKRLILAALFLVLFPLIYITLRQSNLYGGFRHLLFIYPLITAIAASVLFYYIKAIRKKAIKIIVLLIVGAMFYHPVLFSIRNHPLQYIYYNQFTGGLKGASEFYEMDYYYHSVRKASEQLQALNPQLDYNPADTIIIASNFDTEWYFRHLEQPTRHVYTSYYSRGDINWDYGIFVKAFLYSDTGGPKLWPPENTIFTVDADGVPVCAVVKRSSKMDFQAYEAMKSGNPEVAIKLYEQVLENETGNISAYINLGIAYIQSEKWQLAEGIFNECRLHIPEYEPAGFYMAQCMQKTGNYSEAIRELQDLIIFNPKYLKAYIGLSEVYIEMKEFQKAGAYVDQCLEIKPDYKEALRIREKLVTLNN